MTTCGPNKSWRLIHDGVSVISSFESDGMTDSSGLIFEAATEEECARMVVILGLIPIGETASGTVEQIKEAKISALREQCAASILGGYTSSALGAPYHYPAQVVDQVNLLGSIADSTLPGTDLSTFATLYACCDVTGVWAKRPHTAAQIQQVGRDAKAAVLAAQAVYDAAVKALG